MPIVRCNIHDVERQEMAKGDMSLAFQITERLIEQGFCFAEFAIEAAALNIAPKPSHPMKIWYDNFSSSMCYQQEIPD